MIQNDYRADFVGMNNDYSGSLGFTVMISGFCGVCDYAAYTPQNLKIIRLCAKWRV
jgi:hypothetical protein